MNLQEQEILEVVESGDDVTIKEVVRKTRFSHCGVKAKMLDLWEEGYVTKKYDGKQNLYDTTKQTTEKLKCHHQ